MGVNHKVEKVKKALLAMQRHSWEQGVAAQAFLESGNMDTVILMAKEAVVRQIPDGRLAVTDGGIAVTDPACNGEPVLAASKFSGDAKLAEAAHRMLGWLLYKAPRGTDGVIYHLGNRTEVWVDSLYMAPPFLAAAGCYEEAVRQIAAMKKLLFDPEKKLFSHMWDDVQKKFVRKDFWGVGNGWALAGMTRVIGALPTEMPAEREMLIETVKQCIDGCLPYMREDGLFHDVLDKPETFVETNFSQMLAYTLYRGMTGGWLPVSCLKYAELLRAAANGKVDAYGLVQGVCGSPSFDKSGTAVEGQAFFLLMEAAAEGYYNNS